MIIGPKGSVIRKAYDNDEFRPCVIVEQRKWDWANKRYTGEIEAYVSYAGGPNVREGKTFEQLLAEHNVDKVIVCQ